MRTCCQPIRSARHCWRRNDDEKDDYPDDCLHVPRRRSVCTARQRPPLTRCGAAVQERAGRDAGNGYLQWAECESCKHVCPKSFWRNYRTYSFGVAYKPCVTRGRNHYGSLRIGASGGSDTKKFLAGLHFGYEHNYVLRAGWTLYWQVKGDVMIKGADVLRTGVALGIKLPIK